MERHPDGTITLELPTRRQGDGGVWVTTGEMLTVTLRRPTLGEIFDLWEEIDRIGAEQAEAKKLVEHAAQVASDALAAAEDGAEPTEPADEPAAVVAASAIQSNIAMMKSNAEWIRNAIAMLGAPSAYVREGGENGDGRWVIRDDLAEPAWFVGGTVQGQWLKHWQEVPLVPGLAAVT